MFLLNSLRAQHDLIHDALTLPGSAGLNLVFSHFDGYSPLLDGSVRVKVDELSDSEKSGNIVVTINVKASSLSYKNNIRIHQQGNEISISTGGLSLLSYTTAPRLLIEVTISLPHNIGNLDIKTLSLPVFLQDVEKANDVVIISHSAPISVAAIDAHSLTVSSESGGITFEDSSKQQIVTFTKVTNSSGSTKLRSSIYSPSVVVECSSGSLGLKLATTATELKIKGSSGAIGGEVDYVEDNVSISSYENSSGSTNIKLKGWTGFLTAESGSGSKNVGGRGLERWNDGWKKGSGSSTIAFKSRSGSLNVEVL